MRVWDSSTYPFPPRSLPSLSPLPSLLSLAGVWDRAPSAGALGLLRKFLKCKYALWSILVHFGNKLVALYKFAVFIFVMMWCDCENTTSIVSCNSTLI